jgi:hypothetical protein
LADIYRPLSLNQVPIFYTSRRLEIVAKSLPTPLRRSAPPTKRGITERCQTGPFTPVIKPADSQLAYIVSCCAYLLECFPSRLTEVEITI